MNNLTRKHNILLDNTIKSYLKYFNLEMKDGFIFKDELVIFESENKQNILSFLEGISAVVDNPKLNFDGVILK